MVLPTAALSAVLLGGISIFHNIVQEDVLREHKKDLDSLRADIGNIGSSSAYDDTAIQGSHHSIEIEK